MFPRPEAGFGLVTGLLDLHLIMYATTAGLHNSLEVAIPVFCTQRERLHISLTFGAHLSEFVRTGNPDDQRKTGPDAFGDVAEYLNHNCREGCSGSFVCLRNRHVNTAV